MENLRIISSGVKYEFDTASLTLRADMFQTPVGYAKAHIDKWQKCVAIDTAVLPECRNQGIASSLLETLLEKVFVDGEMDEACQRIGTGIETNRVVLSIGLSNIPSRKIATKMGFKEMEPDSHDSMEYSLTKEDYLNNRKKSQSKSPKTLGD